MKSSDERAHKCDSSRSKVSSKGNLPIARKPHDPFIISTTSDKADAAARRMIRSHVMTGKNRTKSLQLGVKLDPWIRTGKVPPRGSDLTPSPNLDISRAGLSLVQFADEMQLYMLELVFKFFTDIGQSLFPIELCVNVGLRNTIWFEYLYIDAACLHSTLWATQNYLDLMTCAGPSNRSLIHESKTISLLRHRLADASLGPVSDITIAVVVILVLNSAVSGKLNTAIRHMTGLSKMVSMRGGISAFRRNMQLETKMCRADLFIALAAGRAPLLYSKADINWNRVLADKEDERWALPKEAGTLAAEIRFVDLWADLKCFTVLANLAFQTGRKIDLELFHGVLKSVMYRAAFLDVSTQPVLRVLHLSVLAFCSAVFIQAERLKTQVEHMSKELHERIYALNTTKADSLEVLLLWSFFVAGLSAVENTDYDWLLAELCDKIRSAGLKSWKEVRNALKTFLWIDVLNDKDGRKLYERAVAIDPPNLE